MNKPVAWMYEDSSGTMKMLGNTQLEEWVTKFNCKEIPLYTHPVKELTDELLMELYEVADYSPESYLEFAKAIIRKAQE